MQSLKEKEYYDAVSSFHKCEANFNSVTKKPDASHNGVCKSISTSLQDDESNLMTPCKRITMYLKYLNDKTTRVDIPLNCKYINYKLNDEVRKLENTSYEHSDLYSKWIAVYRSSPQDISTICKENMQHLDDVIFKKIQDLYNMYHKYNKYITTSGSSNSIECTEFTECVNSYNNYESICTKSSDKNFCNALDSFRIYYQSYSASVVSKCIGTQVLLRSFQMSTEDGQSFIDGGELEEDDDYIDPFGLQYIGTNIFIMFTIIILLSFLFFILYRFTPFGYWLRPRIKNKIKILKIIYEKSTKLYRNTRNEEKDSLKDPINLQYHSMSNS
ncbi:PIR Superfamily Protein [Plasmodium ovale curtisi]|uniref:PIR Superfamily Protein n=1 Tax=Plasmodium ovale curtisi TaxID=864141 RepID=A0A1A8VRX8_PLAOA|nr:PIR Superfamily Protein [Plasmodium ovale curtisi]